jgi:hypothetical protein
VMIICATLSLSGDRSPGGRSCRLLAGVG